MKSKVLAVLVATLFLSGCTDWFFNRFYSKTDTGELKGKIIVEWIDQDRFIFIPDPKKPLTFRRKNNEIIKPGRMYTDGGTIPAALRAVKSYSPWGYAPAFIIHDWLFVMKACHLDGFEKYTLDKAATVLAEVMKTVMENPKFGGPNKLVHYSMYEAVRSKAAKDYWEHGKCNTPTGTRSLRTPSDGATRSMRPKGVQPGGGSKLPRFVIEF